MKRSASILLVVVAVAAVAATGLVLFEGRTIGELRIQNASREQIEVITVQVSGNSIVFKDLKPSEKRAEAFQIGSDSHYEVVAKFASGKAVTGSCGYVTSGMESNDLITVFDNDIRISDSPAGKARKC